MRFTIFTTSVSPTVRWSIVLVLFVLEQQQQFFVDAWTTVFLPSSFHVRMTDPHWVRLNRVESSRYKGIDTTRAAPYRITDKLSSSTVIYQSSTFLDHDSNINHEPVIPPTNYNNNKNNNDVVQQVTNQFLSDLTVTFENVVVSSSDSNRVGISIPKGSTSLFASSPQSDVHSPPPPSSSATTEALETTTSLFTISSTSSNQTDSILNMDTVPQASIDNEVLMNSHETSLTLSSDQVAVSRTDATDSVHPFRKTIDSMLETISSFQGVTCSNPLLTKDDGNVSTIDYDDVLKKCFNAVLLLASFGYAAYTIFSIDSSLIRGWTHEEIAMRLPVDTWSSYESSLEDNPVYTKTLINVIIYLLGDWLSQTIFQQKNILDFDSSRTIKNGFIGLCFGPLVHEYYQFSDHILPVEGGMINRLEKIFMDQTIYLSVKCSIYIVAIGLLNGNSLEQCIQNVKDKIGNICTTAWKFWPLVHLITYNLIPARHRILWVNCVDLIWNAILATKTAAGPDLPVTVPIVVVEEEQHNGTINAEKTVCLTSNTVNMKPERDLVHEVSSSSGGGGVMRKNNTVVEIGTSTTIGEYQK